MSSSIRITSGAYAAKEIRLKVGDASLGTAASEDNTLASVPGRTESKDENKSKDVSELEDGAREVGVMYVYLGAWAPMRMSGSGTSIGSTSSNVPIGKKRSVTSSQKVS